MDENGETKRYDHVLTRSDLDRVEKSISEFRSVVRADLQIIAKGLEKANERHAEADIWRAQIDMRLAAGVERMNQMQQQIEARIKKETVVTLLAGVTLAGGTGGAVLMKLFGG